MVRIEYFHDHMHHVPYLSHLWWSVLGRIWAPEVGEDAVRQWMYGWKNRDLLPVGHIAVIEGHPIGFCALQKTDGIRPDLCPWLTDLCVDPAFQNQGVGGQLIKKTEENARALGFKQLYLFAFDANLPRYYERFGFSMAGLDTHRNATVYVMEKKFS